MKSMNWSLTIGIVAFTCSYLLLGLGAAWVVDASGWSSIWLSYLFGEVVAVGCAVLIGSAIGCVTYRSVAISCFCVQLAALLVSVFLLAAIAYRARQPIHWLHLVQLFVTPGVAANCIVAVISSVLWVFVIRRAAPRLQVRS
jgi:hypothetical protein